MAPCAENRSSNASSAAIVGCDSSKSNTAAFSSMRSVIDDFGNTTYPETHQSIGVQGGTHVVLGGSHTSYCNQHSSNSPMSSRTFLKGPANQHLCWCAPHLSCDRDQFWVTKLCSLHKRRVCLDANATLLAHCHKRRPRQIWMDLDLQHSARIQQRNCKD